MKVIYYAAISIDGFIATSDGGVDWLEAFSSGEEDYGYTEFFNSVDALILGRKTYNQVIGFGDWPYGEKNTWVLTKGNIEPVRPTIHSSNESPSDLVMQLSEHHEKAWLVGGGNLARSFADQDLIDEYMLFAMPCFLGQGVGLFGPTINNQTEASKYPFISNLELRSSQTYDNGTVQLHYVRT